MDRRTALIFYIVIALSLFIGATVQYSEGSNSVGLLLFILALVFLSRIRIEGVHEISSRYRGGVILAIIGVLIIVSDLTYNYRGLGRGGINTLDTMVLLFGASLVALSSVKKEFRNLGIFGAVMSASFVILYISFYIALSHQLYKFDHYFVMLPSAYFIRALGFPIEILGTETLLIGGVSDLVVKIGGPCSGLYSMFLLIGIVAGYSFTEGVENLRSVAGLVLIAAIVAYLGNFLRVSALYVIGYLFGGATMMAVHIHLGWMIFAVTSLFVLFFLDRMRFRAKG